MRANNHLDSIAEHVEKAPHSAQMFGAVKSLKKRDVKRSISVTYWYGAFIAQDKEKASVVAEHLHQQFTSVNISAIQSPPPLELNTPISEPEVIKALQRLNNRKACGEDNIPSELLKNGGKVVASFIATFLNTPIVQGLDLSDIIGRGILVPLAKPNKPLGPLSSLRPVVLLNSVRKVFSLIVLRRISKDVSEYLGHISSGFRAGRSTSDVVFAQRWISAKVQRFPCKYYALGLDMSKAFDTVNREKILNIMSSFVGQDEVHMIHHLLYGTEMKVRIGKSLSEGFTSTIGTPQGDSLSPILFVCYLEAALRDCRRNLLCRPPADNLIPQEIGYADDITFFSTSESWLQSSLPVISSTLKTWHLNVNEQKTEWVKFVKSDTEWRSVKQLGSLLGEAEDIERRIELASQAYGRFHSLWLRRQRVSEKRRIRLYNALVLPVLLYNCGTWGPTKAMLERLDRFHRRQLRNLIGVHYPDRITNMVLYERCYSKLLSIIVHKRRLQLVGHIMRLCPQCPPCLAMSCYFSGDAKGRRGRPPANLATTLIQDFAGCGIRLKGLADLGVARDAAADRSTWRSSVVNCD